MSTTLPAISNIQVATVPLAGFLSRQASILAAAGTASPLPEINFLAGTLKIGDGAVSGAAQCPLISTLQATNALTHQVWSGLAVQSCAQNSTSSTQIDILCVIPAVDASGNEIGPFWVTEFILTDENGTPMVAGVTAAPKYVTANGGATDLAFIVSVAFAVGTVVLTAPSEPFLSKSSAQAALANIVSGVSPIVVTKRPDAAGWTDFAVSMPPAAQAADPISASSDLASVGYGRPATAAEFAAGAAAAGAGFSLPWPTLAQVRAYVDGVATLTSGASTGYLRFRNGLMLQWGNATWPANPHYSQSTADVVFPIAFSSWSLAFGAAETFSNAIGYPPVFMAKNLGKLGFTAQGDLLGGDGGDHLFDYAVNFCWLAIGV